MVGRPTALRFPAPAGSAVRSQQAAASSEAFERAYLEARDELHRYARSIVRDPDVADDVLQTVMVRALAALQDEPRDFELRPWLFRITHNVAIDRMRRARPTSELDASVAAPGPATPELVDQQARLTQLWTDLADLGERQRQALILRELSGLSHDEIAATVGCSSRSVKQTIFEARRALLECAEGRDMRCDDVQRTLSDGDGRVRRGRKLRSHLAACPSCRSFDAALASRPAELAAMVPLLPALAGGALAGLAPGGEGAAHAAGAMAATSSTGSAGLTASGVTGAATAGTASVGAATGVGASVSAAAGSIAGIVATKTAVFAVAGATVLGAGGVAVERAVSPPPAPPATAPSTVPASLPTAGTPAASSTPDLTGAAPDRGEQRSGAADARNQRPLAAGRDRPQGSTPGRSDQAAAGKPVAPRPERPSRPKPPAAQTPASRAPERPSGGGGATKPGAAGPATGRESTPSPAPANPPAASGKPDDAGKQTPSGEPAPSAAPADPPAGGGGAGRSADAGSNAGK